jgi:hypothetical protein
MKQPNLNTISKYPRILALAPSSYGVGFARMEDVNVLADWGLKYAEGDKNGMCVAHAKRLIEIHQPEVIVLEDSSSQDVRRNARVRMLTKQIVGLAEKSKIPVLLLQRKDVFQSLLPGERGTKYALAEIIAQRFPDELGRHLPPKRKPWMKEDYRMSMFASVALAVAFGCRNRIAK